MKTKTPPTRKKQSDTPSKAKPAPAAKIVVQAEGGVHRLASCLGTIHARKTAAIANKKNEVDVRDGVESEITELSDEARAHRSTEYIDACVRLRESLKRIEDFDATVKAANAAYDRLASDAGQGKFTWAERDADELLSEMRGGQHGDPQMTLAEAQEVGPDSDWEHQARRYPEMFGDREYALVGVHVETLAAASKAGKVSPSPLGLAQYFERQYRSLKTTAERAQILPKLPAWFMAGVRDVLAVYAAGDGGTKGDERHETDAASLLTHLGRAADKDVDAWIAFAGRDSVLNLAVASVSG